MQSRLNFTSMLTLLALAGGGIYFAQAGHTKVALALLGLAGAVGTIAFASIRKFQEAVISAGAAVLMFALIFSPDIGVNANAIFPPGVGVPANAKALVGALVLLGVSVAGVWIMLGGAGNGRSDD